MSTLLILPHESDRLSYRLRLSQFNFMQASASRPLTQGQAQSAHAELEAPRTQLGPMTVCGTHSNTGMD